MTAPSFYAAMSETYDQALSRISAELVALAFQRAQMTTEAVAAARVRSMLETRRTWREKFGSDMFADEPWDLMLELYACHLEGRFSCVAKLHGEVGIPLSTVMRLVRRLEGRGLVERRADETDGRRIHIGLTNEGVERMEEVLALRH